MDTSTLSPKHLWLPILVVAVGGAFYISGKMIEVRGNQQVSISVEADGKVAAPPDIAALQFGVQTGRQPNAQAAMQMLTKKMKAVIEAAKKEGVADKDMTTQSLNLYPAYDYEKGTQVFRGFEASESLSVKVRDLEKISAVLNGAVNAGSNQIGSVNFTIDDPNTLRARARELAIQKAKDKAEILADQLGVRLGVLKGFSEGGGYQPPYPMMNYAKEESRAQGGAMDAAVPVPMGEQEITVSVTLTYEIR